MMVERDSKCRCKYTSTSSCRWCLRLCFLWLEWDVRRVKVFNCDFIWFLNALVLLWRHWLLLKFLCLEYVMRSLKVSCLIEVCWVCKTLMESECATLTLKIWVWSIAILIVIIIQDDCRRFPILKGRLSRVVLLLLFFLDDLMKLCWDLRHDAPLVNEAFSL